jgi:hypothetical protein
MEWSTVLEIIKFIERFALWALVGWHISEISKEG